MKQPVNNVAVGTMGGSKIHEVNLQREDVAFPICRGKTRLGAIRMSMRRMAKYHKQLMELEKKELLRLGKHPY